MRQNEELRQKKTALHSTTFTPLISHVLCHGFLAFFFLTSAALWEAGYSEGAGEQSAGFTDGRKAPLNESFKKDFFNLL